MYNVTLARDGTSPIRQDFIKIKKISQKPSQALCEASLQYGEINLWCEKLTDNKEIVFS